MRSVTFNFLFSDSGEFDLKSAIFHIQFLLSGSTLAASFIFRLPCILASVVSPFPLDSCHSAKSTSDSLSSFAKGQSSRRLQVHAVEAATAARHKGGEFGKKDNTYVNIEAAFVLTWSCSTNEKFFHAFRATCDCSGSATK